MKKNLFTSTLILIAFLQCTAQNLIDNYLTNPFTYTTVGSSANQVSVPRDLDFKPSTNELWVLNKGTSNGGSVVIFHDAGMPTQTSEYRKDTHTGHFMMNSSAMAFSENGEWGSIGEFSPSTGTFMGPSLWPGDLNIFANVFQNNWVSDYPLGSHLDMLHQSPLGMGIASDSAKVYWVFDGFNGNICKYDYVEDHGPGFDNHSAGKIWRYTDVSVLREVGVPSHLVLDKSTGWLYFADTGNKKLKRMNTNSGAFAGNLSSPNEVLAGYYNMTGATVEVIDSYPATMPSGVDANNGRLIVSDYTNGNIYVYNISGATPVFMDTIITGQNGIMGVKIGTDGKIWFVNSLANTVVRIDPVGTTNDAAIESITSPALIIGNSKFYSPDYNVCSPIAPVVTLKNNGTNNLNSVTINYMIDAGTPGTFAWTGTLLPGTSASVTLPTLSIADGAHNLTVFTSNPNGTTDNNPANDRKGGAFRMLATLATVPFNEGFTSSTFPPAGWSYINYNPNNEMSKSPAVGGFGNTPSGCLKMDNFSTHAIGSEIISGQIDYFISPKIDFSATTNGTVLDFSVAYAQYSSLTSDQLEVHVSTDCGANWILVYNKSGTALATTTNKVNAFTPSATEWRKETIDLNSYIAQPELMVMFKTTSDYGNNIYIDDINVHNTTGISSGIEKSEISILPNPSNGKFSFSSNNEITELTVYNVLGEKIFFQNINLGNYFSADLTAQSSGVYFVTFRTSTQFFSNKLIKL